MGRFVKGNIITIDFPESNFEKTNRRPAIVLSDHEIESNITICQITKVKHTDDFLIVVHDHNFIGGKFQYQSYIRPNVIMTADIDKHKPKLIGRLSANKIDEINNKLKMYLQIN